SVNRLRIAQDLTAPHQGSTLAEAVRDVRGRVMLSKTISSWGRMLGLGKGDGAEEERRLWGRISCDVETTIAAAASDVGPALPARLRTFSRGGINLSSGSKFEPGALLSVSLPVGDGTQILACVVRCEPLDSGLWELGCTFAAELSDEDLQNL